MTFAVVPEATRPTGYGVVEAQAPDVSEAPNRVGSRLPNAARTAGLTADRIVRSDAPLASACSTADTSAGQGRRI